MTLFKERGYDYQQSQQHSRLQRAVAHSQELCPKNYSYFEKKDVKSLSFFSFSLACTTDFQHRFKE